MFRLQSYGQFFFSRGNSQLVKEIPNAVKLGGCLCNWNAIIDVNLILQDLRRSDEDFSFLMVQYTADKVADPVTDPREAEAEHRKQEEVLKR